MKNKNELKTAKIKPTKFDILLWIVFFILAALYLTFLDFVQHNFNVPNIVLALLGAPLPVIFCVFGLALCIWYGLKGQYKWMAVASLMFFWMLGITFAHIGKVAIIGMFFATIPAVVASIYVIKCAITDGFEEHKSTSYRWSAIIGFSVVLLVALYFGNLGFKDAVEGTKTVVLHNCSIENDTQIKSAFPEYDYLVGYKDENGEKLKLQILDVDAADLIGRPTSLTVEYYENMKIVVEVLE